MTKEFLGYWKNEKLLRSELELDPQRAVDIIERLFDEIKRLSDALRYGDDK